MRELQPFCSVHGHHGHAVVAVGLAVQIRIQRHFVQKAGQRRLTFDVFQITLNAGFQLFDVFQASAALHIVLFPQCRSIAALVADHIIQFDEVTALHLLAHRFNQLCKGDKLASCVLQFRIIRRLPEHLIERGLLLCGDGLGLVHGGLSDLAGGHVDNAAEPQIVGGIVDDAQVCQHILDLCTVEELHTAVNFVRYAVALERIFQRVGLGVHTVQHGVIFPIAAAAVVRHHLTHHVIGLVTLVEGGLDDHLFAVSILRPQRLALAALVVADDSVGRVQNVLGRAVVLLQTDSAGAAVLLLEAEDVADVRAAEAVDALVIVSHHADVAPAACQQAHQQVLQVVGVLILIDEDVAELPLVALQHVGAALQQPDGVQNDVIEVQRIGLAQLFTVKRIYFTYPDTTPVVNALPVVDELLRRLHAVLGL